MDSSSRRPADHSTLTFLYHQRIMRLFIRKAQMRQFRKLQRDSDILLASMMENDTALKELGLREMRELSLRQSPLDHPAAE